MGRLKEMKKQYESIPIPEELAIRVGQEIAKSRRKLLEQERRRLQKAVQGIGIAAAGVGLVFTLTLNTIPAFAMEAARLPVLGGLVRVLTFRSYETEKDDIGVSVEIPSIEMIEKDTKIQVDAINQEILRRCNEYAEEATVQAEEYRTAFLETGGTLEEWAAHNIKILVDYEIKQQDDKYLSFVVRGYESWSSANNVSRYYNLDLGTGKEVTLRDLLGDDYEALANDSIRQQIAEREQAGESFFAEDAGGFTGISENTKFYIGANHNPVIVFDKYEIANGAAGEIQFEIGSLNTVPVETTLPAKEAAPMTLESLLGADYVKSLTETITMQMENRMDKNPGVRYYPIEEQAPLGNYVTIGEETQFKVDEEGCLVITFPAGTITDAANGAQTFRIQKAAVEQKD